MLAVVELAQNRLSSSPLRLVQRDAIDGGAAFTELPR